MFRRLCVIATLRGELSAARESLVTMLTNKDKRGADQQRNLEAQVTSRNAELARGMGHWPPW